MLLSDRFVAGLVPLLPKAVVGQVAKRYVSGEDLESALRTTTSLNQDGFSTTLDVLGEDIERIDQATEAVIAYQAVLAEIHTRQLDSNISIKLSALGLKIDEERCFQNVRILVADARARRNFVRIDMEDSSTTTATLDIYRKLRGEFDNVGVVLQARLKRSLDDARELAAMNARVRVCKGIYMEPPDIAHQTDADINRSFIALCRELLGKRCHVGIATHDASLVKEGYALLSELGGCGGHYEFQMLLGVTERLRRSISAAGHPLRVYVPFGREWYAYSIRRLRENPQIAGHVFRAMLGLD